MYEQLKIPNWVFFRILSINQSMSHSLVFQTEEIFVEDTHRQTHIPKSDWILLSKKTLKKIPHGEKQQKVLMERVAFKCLCIFEEVAECTEQLKIS